MGALSEVVRLLDWSRLHQRGLLVPNASGLGASLKLSRTRWFPPPPSSLSSPGGGRQSQGQEPQGHKSRSRKLQQDSGGWEVRETGSPHSLRRRERREGEEQGRLGGRVGPEPGFAH